MKPIRAADRRRSEGTRHRLHNKFGPHRRQTRHSLLLQSARSSAFQRINAHSAFPSIIVLRGEYFTDAVGRHTQGYQLSMHPRIADPEDRLGLSGMQNARFAAPTNTVRDESRSFDASEAAPTPRTTI